MNQSLNSSWKGTATGMEAPQSRAPDRNVLMQAAFASLMLISIASVCLLAVAHPGWAQTVQVLEIDVNVVAKGLRASKLIGSSVNNDKNEKVGTLDDIIVGRDRVLFAVLQVGGFLGIGAHLVAVPYQSLVIDDAGKKIELPGATRETLRKLAEFKHRA